MQARFRLVAWFLIAALAAGSMWFYVECILIPYQRADAAAHDRPRGNLSDLYPRWLGARELLLHRRNPYSDEITKEIQRGYYGRELDPARPNDPKDQEAFTYPIHVVFVLAPLIGLPFFALRVPFFWLLALLTAMSVWLWLRVLRWRLPPIAVATWIVFALGSLPAVQGIKVQQLSLLVAAFLAGATACAASGRLLFSGTLLALATVKPQLGWPLVAWLLLWAVSDWRARRKLAISFSLTMAVLLAAAELLLPGWWRMFTHAIVQYRRYTGSQSVLEVLLNGAIGSGADGFVGHAGAQILALIATLSCAIVLWRLRKNSAEDAGFGRATAMVLALTALVVPMSAPYNQVLLLPSILLLAREPRAFVSGSLARKFAYLGGIVLIGWPWAASLCLMAIDLLISPARASAAWQWPFFATLLLPVWIFGLTIIQVKNALVPVGNRRTSRKLEQTQAR